MPGVTSPTTSDAGGSAQQQNMAAVAAMDTLAAGARSLPVPFSKERNPNRKECPNGSKWFDVSPGHASLNHPFMGLFLCQIKMRHTGPAATQASLEVQQQFDVERWNMRACTTQGTAKSLRDSIRGT